MVQGMAFLSKKRFNPKNLSNQKAVWEAQQEQEIEAKRVREREDQLRRERDDEELARARGGSRGGNEVALRFMYGPPPGLPNEKTNTESSTAVETTTQVDAASTDIGKRQPGDDDAAAAFRQMLAAASAPVGDDLKSAEQANVDTTTTISGAALSGTTVEAAAKGNESLSALEKAVGRKDANRSLTLEEQVARFPQLKNAPMAKGMSATNVNVSFNPLGTQLRHIRCMACGVWGHSRGDRECELSGWNPFATSATPSVTPASDNVAKGKSGILPDKERKEDKRRRDTESDSSDSESDEEDRRRRKKRERKHKSSSRRRRREEKRRRRRLPSEDRSRKQSRKRSRKHASREN